jgi:glutamyl-tRNA synthetase
MSNVKVRFPPSPTGFCHVGTARMALINYLFAKKHGGQIIFRSEDTDKERSSKEFEQDIVDSIQWLGLDWDEFFRQSERTPIYVELIQKLISEDKAYISEEDSKKNAGEKVRIVRLRNPGKVITFSDIIRGEITFDTTELKDFAIARAIDDPLYHLTVVIDDALMGITHVIRGEEHISNTPRQILIQEALGYERPIYAHYPLFLGSDRSKLSKRTGDTAVREYRDAGFLSDALRNYIGVLGWTPPSGREILSLEEMISDFDLKDLHKSGAVFDMEKLRWFNREYLLKMRDDDFEAEALRRLQNSLAARNISWDEATARKLMPLLRERTHVWSDIETMVEAGELDLFFADPQPEVAAIPQKGTSPQDAVKHLRSASELLSAVSDEEFSDAEKVKAAVWPYAEQEGRGAVLWPLRFSLSGLQKSPDPFMMASTIGKASTLRRINTAITLLDSRAQ